MYSGSAITAGLAVAPEGNRGVVFLNLLFCSAIIILPVTNGLYGVYRLDGVIAVIYGSPPHADRRAELRCCGFSRCGGRYDPHRWCTRAVSGRSCSCSGTAIAFVAPKIAQFTWCLAFLAPLAGWLAGHRA